MWRWLISWHMRNIGNGSNYRDPPKYSFLWPYTVTTSMVTRSQISNAAVPAGHKDSETRSNTCQLSRIMLAIWIIRKARQSWQIFSNLSHNLTRSCVILLKSQLHFDTGQLSMSGRHFNVWNFNNPLNSVNFKIPLQAFYMKFLGITKFKFQGSTQVKIKVKDTNLRRHIWLEIASVRSDNSNWNVIGWGTKFYLFSRLCRRHLGKSEPQEALQQENQCTISKRYMNQVKNGITEQFCSKLLIRTSRVQTTASCCSHQNIFYSQNAVSSWVTIQTGCQRLKQYSLYYLTHEQTSTLMLVLIFYVSDHIRLSRMLFASTEKSAAEYMLLTTSSINIKYLCCLMLKS